MKKGKNIRKRIMVSVPEGTKIYSLLSNNKKGSNCELLEEMISQLPKSKTEKAVEVLNEAIEEISHMYPDAKNNLIIIKPYILKQILGIELTETGFQQNGKTRLSDEYFEALKNV